MTQHRPDRWIEVEALHRAAAAGDLAEIRQLLHAGYAISRFDEFGATPLHCAVRAEQYQAVKYLLEHQAEVNALNDFSRSSAIALAAEGNDPAIVSLLLSHGADPKLIGASMGKSAYDFARHNINAYGDEIRQVLGVKKAP